MRILGIASETHDSGIAIVEDGKPVLVIEEERLSRIKHTQRFPAAALAAAIEGGWLKPDGIDVIVTPWHATVLRQTFMKAILRNLPSSLNLLRPSANTAQRTSIIALNQWLKYKLTRALGVQRLPPFHPVRHHHAHAAIFFVSPFEEANILVMDGYGDDAATSTYVGHGNQIKRLWQSDVFNSLGMIYTFVTGHLGFRDFEEGTVMALAAHGDDRYVQKFRDTIRLVENGRYEVDMSYFMFDKYAFLRPFSAKFFATFGPPRRSDEPMSDHHKALARALQVRLEETVLHVARGLHARNPSRDLVVSGGVALNCVANARILEETDYERVWVPPCASDTGGPLGAALWFHHQRRARPRDFVLTHPFYGLEPSDNDIRLALYEAGLVAERLDDQALFARVARDLAEGRIVGWFQGRFEMGPRALGNRSILADPRRLATKDRINARIKYRESFRPFAPVVLAEHTRDYFEIEQADPFMTMAPRVRPEKRDVIPAVVHIDGTARLQTVEREANPRYYAVIEAFMRETGVPVLINTSFNRQEPIVATAREAVSCYLRTEMDVLVLGNFYTSSRNAESEIRARSDFAVRDENLVGGE
jgi:carbamoyltransferase